MPDREQLFNFAGMARLHGTGRGGLQATSDGFLGQNDLQASHSESDLLNGPSFSTIGNARRDDYDITAEAIATMAGAIATRYAKSVESTGDFS